MTPQPESWRPVSGCSGTYEVSDQGRVRSMPRVVMRAHGLPHTIRARVLAQYRRPSGHMTVKFRNGAGLPRIDRFVHVLVLEAFVGPAPEAHQCRHLDGNPANNHLANLAWGTRAENNYDRAAHGVCPQRNKTHCPRGHALEEPNLTAASRRRGLRTCLACHRGTARRIYLRDRGVHLDLQLIADLYYREILAGSTKTPRLDVEIGGAT